MHFNFKGRNFDSNKWTVASPEQAGQVAAVASYGLGQAIAATNAGFTGGASHLYEGETVASSARAKKIGGGIASVLAGAIPLVGSLVGAWAGRGVAAIIDRERDKANAITAEAQKQ